MGKIWLYLPVTHFTLQSSDDIINQRLHPQNRAMVHFRGSQDHLLRHVDRLYSIKPSDEPLVTPIATDNGLIGSEDLHGEDMAISACHGHVLDRTFWGEWKDVHDTGDLSQYYNPSGKEAYDEMIQFLQPLITQPLVRFGQKSGWDLGRKIAPQSDRLKACKPNSSNFGDKRLNHVVCSKCYKSIAKSKVTPEVFSTYWHHHTILVYRIIHQHDERRMRCGTRIEEFYPHNVNCPCPATYGKHGPDNDACGLVPRPITSDWYSFSVPDNSIEWAMGPQLSTMIANIKSNQYVVGPPFVPVSNGMIRYPYDDRHMAHLPFTEYGNSLLPNIVDLRMHKVCTHFEVMCTDYDH